MLINTIQLENYACFKNLSVAFNGNFTVIVGINGSGKTSLLQAIKDHLGLNFQLLPSTNEYFVNPMLSVTNDGISYSFKPQYPVKIAVEANHFINSSIENSICQQEKDNRTVNYTGSLSYSIPLNINDIAATMPLSVFYTDDRHWSSANLKSDLLIAQQKVNRLEAFNNWDKASLNPAALQEWVVSKTLERLQKYAKDGKPISDFDQSVDELSFVNQAISAVIPEAKGISYDIGQRSVFLERRDGADPGGKAMLFEKLSSGEQVVVGLVADLARRACLLNPHLGSDAVSKTPGVVLIDELDLHLHPSWQRRLPKGLKAAFPAMQFIASTRSPLILSELTPNEIIILDNFQAYAPESSYGLNTDHILVEMFGTSYRPDEIDSELKVLFEAINQGELAKAKTIIKNLSDKAPGIWEIDGAKALIMRKEAIGR